MTTSLHGNVVIQTTELPGRNRNLEHSIGTRWMSLRRWENDMKVVAPVDLGTAVSALKGLVGFSSINGMADTARVDSEARMPATARADARDLQELVPQTCYRSRTQFIERLVDIPVLQQRQAPTAQTAQESMEMSQEQFLDKVVDMPVVVQRQVLMVQTVQKTLECRVEIASPGWTIFNMTEVESQPMEATTTAKTTSDILVRLFLAVLYTWGRLDDKSLSRPDQEVTLSLVLREAQERHLHRSLTERSLMKSHAIIDAMERANHTLGEALRTLTHATGTRVGSRSETDEPLICWMMRHTTEGPLLRRFGTTVAERTDVCWRSRPGGCAWIETAA